MQVALIHQSHVFSSIKISRTIFKKGHPRSNSGKLFQNLTIGFREEDFLRIPSFLYSASSPHSPEPHFLTDQNFTNTFWKGSPKEHICEIISQSDQRFQRRKIPFGCHGNQSFWRNQILCTIFKEDLPRNTPAKFGPNWPSGLGVGWCLKNCWRRTTDTQWP